MGATAFPEIDEDVDSVRGRLTLEAVPVPESGGWLPEPTLAGDSRTLTRETVRFLIPKSGGLLEPTAHDSSLGCPSSLLFTVMIDADDVLRALFRERATSRSSDRLP